MAVKRKVLIGIPNKGDVKFDTLASLLSVLSVADYDMVVMGYGGACVDHQRNVICYAALKQEASHVLFIDTDMEFRSLTANKLLALDKAVVGVASRRKKFPLEYTIQVIEDGKNRQAKNEEVFTEGMPAEPFCRIGGNPITVGAGIMLIDLEKIKGVPKPWFKMDTYWREGEEPGYTGEDIYFCRKVWAAGLEVWCDPTIPVGHIGDCKY